MASLTSYLRTVLFLLRVIRGRAAARFWHMDRSRRLTIGIGQQLALMAHGPFPPPYVRDQVAAPSWSEFSPSSCLLSTLTVPGFRFSKLEPGYVP